MGNVKNGHAAARAPKTRTATRVGAADSRECMVSAALVMRVG